MAQVERTWISLARVDPIRSIIAASTLALTVGCLTGGSRGQALYPPTNPPPRADEVAQLTGYVEQVDGKDISTYGKSFELLPGCHVIATPTGWGTFSNVGAYIAKTGRLMFALPMKPARQYVITVRTDQGSGPGSSAVVEATEKDFDGNTLTVFRPARSREDVAGCMAAASTPRSPDQTDAGAVDNPVSDAGTGD